MPLVSFDFPAYDWAKRAAESVADLITGDSTLYKFATTNVGMFMPVRKEFMEKHAEIMKARKEG